MMNPKTVLWIALSFALTVCGTSPAWAVSEAEVLPTLMDIHGSNWSSHIKSEQDRSQIRSILKGIIDQKAPASGSVFAGLGEESYALIRERAISEYGKFVQEAAGGISADALKYYQAEAARPSSPGRVQLLESLRNANTPETASILLALIQNPGAPVEDRTYAIRLMEDVFSEAPQKPAEGQVAYEPNLGKPMAERVHPERWAEVAKRAEKILQDISKDSKLPPFTVASARESLQVVQNFMQPQGAKRDEGTRHVFYNPAAPAVPQAPQGPVLAAADPARSPASAPSGGGPLRMFLLVGAIVMSGIAGVVFHKVKQGDRDE